MSYDDRFNNFSGNQNQQGQSLGSDQQVPNFEERFRQISAADRDRIERQTEPGSGGDDPQEPEGCLSFITGNRSAWLFVLVLAIAAFRGGMDKGGCMPGRNCMNVLLTAATGIGLFIGGLYLLGNSQATGVATIMACAGVVICGGSMSGTVFLMFSIFRMVDVNPWDNQDGGVLDSVLGMLGGGDRR